MEVITEAREAIVLEAIVNHEIEAMSIASACVPTKLWSESKRAQPKVYGILFT
jgi:hypothetical protein